MVKYDFLKDWVDNLDPETQIKIIDIKISNFMCSYEKCNIIGRDKIKTITCEEAQSIFKLAKKDNEKVLGNLLGIISKLEKTGRLYKKVLSLILCLVEEDVTCKSKIVN